MQVTRAGAEPVPASFSPCFFTHHGAGPPGQTHWARGSSQCQLKQKERCCFNCVPVSLPQWDMATLHHELRVPCTL